MVRPQCKNMHGLHPGSPHNPLNPGVAPPGRAGEVIVLSAHKGRYCLTSRTTSQWTSKNYKSVVCNDGEPHHRTKQRTRKLVPWLPSKVLKNICTKRPVLQRRT